MVLVLANAQGELRPLEEGPMRLAAAAKVIEKPQQTMSLRACAAKVLQAAMPSGAAQGVLVRNASRPALKPSCSDQNDICRFIDII